MKHETKLAMALSSEQNLEEHFRENYTTDELAELLLEKRAFWGAGTLAAGINRAAPMIRSGVKALSGATMGQAAGIGAAGGAVMGAGRHLLSRRDAQGNKKTTLLGSTLGGAAIGTGLGLGARMGARQFEGTGLHKRMISGDFKFAPPAAQQPTIKGMDLGAPNVRPVTEMPARGGAGMPTPAAPAPAVPAAAGAPAQREPFMRRVHRALFGGGAPAQPAA